MTGAVLVDVLVDGEAEVLGAVLVESETGVVEAEAAPEVEFDVWAWVQLAKARADKANKIFLAFINSGLTFLFLSRTQP